MHVVYLAQFYNEPSDAGAGRHYAFTRALAGRGHRVTIITGQENYRTGEISERWRGRFVHREERDGVTILRTWVVTGHRRRFALRYANHLSFLVTGLWAGLRAGPRPDVIVASSPPLFVAVAGALLSALRRAPLVTDVRDLWPESVLALDLPVSRPLIKGGFAIARWVYGRSRRLIAVTRGIQTGLLQQGQPRKKIAFIPNGVDLHLYDEVGQGDDLRRAHGLEGKFVCTYVGGMGPVHNVGTLVKAAALLKDDGDVHFLIVGDGGEKVRLVDEAKSKGLANVTFLDPVSKRDVPAVLRAGDVCVYSLRRNPFFEGVFPNKNFDYLASGRPVILAVSGESRRLVEDAKAGFVVSPESAEELAAAIRRMRGLPLEERDAMGSRGRAHVLTTYHRSKLADGFANLVEAAGGASSPVSEAAAAV
jgi:glycosyltransferase involved in cell wall biosynthesis